MKYLIFDFNGTLVDDMPLVIKLMNDRLKPKGIDLYSYPLEELRQTGVKKFIKQIKLSKIEFLWLFKDLKKRIREGQNDCPLVKNMVEILPKLSEKHTLLIYSSNTPETILAYLKKNKINDYFQGIYEDDSYFGKEVGLKRIVKKLNINSTEFAYIGDESRDIVAAQKAGMTSIAVAWGFEGDIPLSEVKPNYLLTKPEELLNLK